MNLFAQTLDKLRATANRSSTARPFSDLSAHKTIRQHRQMGAMLNIESPFFRLTEGLQGDKTLIDGKPVTNFAWTDYLALSQHPALREAAKAAIDQYGASISASRMVSGDTALHRELERELADFIGVDASLVFTSGHSANVSTIGAMMSVGDLIVHDEFMHNSGFIGTKLSGATARSFRHNRMDKLEAILRDERAKYRNALVLIEGQYSADGDVPDLARAIELKEKYGAWLMVDEAHSLGVIGRTGRGIAEYCDIDPHKVDIWMGVLSKAFGSVGGYIAGSIELIEILRYSAPAFVFSVGLSPASTAATLAALRVIKGEPERVKRLHDNGALFLNEAHDRGLDTGQALGFGMLPIMVGRSTRSAKLVQQMYERGINTSIIIYPGVPLNAGRVRFFLTSEHTPEEIQTAIKTAEEELKKI